MRARAVMVLRGARKVLGYAKHDHMARRGLKRGERGAKTGQEVGKGEPFGRVGRRQGWCVLGALELEEASLDVVGGDGV
jgi:hypothetical protein